MNQIIVSKRIYMTPEFNKKKKFYKLQFFISIFLICVLFSYYIYAEYDRNRNEAIAREILATVNFTYEEKDETVIEEVKQAIIVYLNGPEELVVEQQEQEPEPEPQTVPEQRAAPASTITYKGTEYNTIARISIPKLGIEYPILSEFSDDLLKISPCKWWGPEPNEVGNFCIVGHNYRNTLFFSKVPTLELGDVIELTDLTGRTITYQIYDKYIVDPEDASCTSQVTHGKKEVTLITCTNDSKQRVVLKTSQI